MKQTMAQLSVEDEFSPNNGYWKMKAAAGNRPKREMNSVIKEKENGVEVKGKTSIIAEYRKEFRHRLRNRSPEPGLED